MHTVSIDEMTGIQALERAAPTLPMKPGHRGIALGNPLIFDVVLARFGRDRF